MVHINPKPYLVIKETLLKEAMKQGGSLKKKDARALCKVCSSVPFVVVDANDEID